MPEDGPYKQRKQVTTQREKSERRAIAKAKEEFLANPGARDLIKQIEALEKEVRKLNRVLSTIRGYKGIEVSGDSDTGIILRGPKEPQHEQALAFEELQVPVCLDSSSPPVLRTFYVKPGG